MSFSFALLERYNIAMWGWTFPAAALAGAFERAGSSLSDPLYHFLASASLVIATLTVTACAGATPSGWVQAMRVRLRAA